MFNFRGGSLSQSPALQYRSLPEPRRWRRCFSKTQISHKRMEENKNHIKCLKSENASRFCVFCVLLSCKCEHVLEDVTLSFHHFLIDEWRKWSTILKIIVSCSNISYLYIQCFFKAFHQTLSVTTLQDFYLFVSLKCFSSKSHMIFFPGGDKCINT